MQHTSNSNTDITSTRKRVKLMELIFAWKIFEEFFLKVKMSDMYIWKLISNKNRKKCALQQEICMSDKNP